MIVVFFDSRRFEQGRVPSWRQSQIAETARNQMLEAEARTRRGVDEVVTKSLFGNCCSSRAGELRWRELVRRSPSGSVVIGVDVGLFRAAYTGLVTATATAGWRLWQVKMFAFRIISRLVWSPWRSSKRAGRRSYGWRRLRCYDASILDWQKRRRCCREVGD